MNLNTLSTKRMGSGCRNSRAPHFIFIPKEGKKNSKVWQMLASSLSLSPIPKKSLERSSVEIFKHWKDELFVPPGWSSLLYYYSAICCQSLPERQTKHRTICERLCYVYCCISEWENRKEKTAPMFQERHWLLIHHFLSIPFSTTEKKKAKGGAFRSPLWFSPVMSRKTNHCTK